ncbi:MAG: hypothetical protein PXX77_04960, partial [Gallionella sp.]|nr:hypothetical protein [Gallionella sp.]
ELRVERDAEDARQAADQPQHVLPGVVHCASPRLVDLLVEHWFVCFVPGGETIFTKCYLTHQLHTHTPRCVSLFCYGVLRLHT